MFASREEAGGRLAGRLGEYENKPDVIVVGIPRGGVVVAKKVADKLNLPLDVVVVKKIGAPNQSELAIGAVGPKKTVYWDEDLCNKLGTTVRQKEELKKAKEKERAEREKLLRNNKTYNMFRNKTVILVDDGIATGATVICAQEFLRKIGANQVVLAVPVVASDIFRNITKYFDAFIVLLVANEFYSVGQFYKSFPQVEDEEVKQLLS